MQSAKMIYPDKKLAGAILSKMKKRYSDDEWSRRTDRLSSDADAEAIVCWLLGAVQAPRGPG